MCALCVPVFAACTGTLRARVELYAPQTGARPSLPVVLSHGTVWYEDANLTALVPFDVATHTFGTPVPDPTAIPSEAVSRLRGAPLAPRSLAADARGNLWGVGTAETRWGKLDYASTNAIVEYDPHGSARAYPVPVDYTPGYAVFAGPNKRPWSMIWTEFPAGYAAVVQLNGDGTVTPEFTIARNRLPRLYTDVRYAKYGAHGIVWLLDVGSPRLSVTRWILGSRNVTEIALAPESGAKLLTTAPDGSAWVMAQELSGQRYDATYAYRISPAGHVSRYALAMPFPEMLSPAAMFAANGCMFGVAVVAYGPNIGNAYLVRIDPSGVLTYASVDGVRGAIAQEQSSIAGPGDTAFLAGFSGALPELTYTL